MGKRRRAKKSAPHELIGAIGALLTGIAAMIAALAQLVKD